MYSSDNIFKNIIVIDYDSYIFCIFSIGLDINAESVDPKRGPLSTHYDFYIFYILIIGLDINKTINHIIEHNCSKYQFRPQDQTDDTGRTRSLRREPQMHVRYADGGVLLLLQEVHERSSKWPPFWVYHDWTRWY